MQHWLTYAVVTTLFWGVWGALIELPEKRGFPATLGYVVWSLTMIPCALVALSLVGWKLETDARSVALGPAAGLLGAGGQLALFEALRRGPGVPRLSHRVALAGDQRRHGGGAARRVDDAPRVDGDRPGAHRGAAALLPASGRLRRRPGAACGSGWRSRSASRGESRPTCCASPTRR